MKVKNFVKRSGLVCALILSQTYTTLASAVSDTEFYFEMISLSDGEYDYWDDSVLGSSSSLIGSRDIKPDYEMELDGSTRYREVVLYNFYKDIKVKTVSDMMKWTMADHLGHSSLLIGDLEESGHSTDDICFLSIQC